MMDRTVNISVPHWIRTQIRLAALEQSGPKLAHRFEFPQEDTVICKVFYAGDREISALPDAEKAEIFDGWVQIGKNIMRYALDLAELPEDVVWQTTVRFVLYESCGMGGSVIHESTIRFLWPESPLE